MKIKPPFSHRIIHFSTAPNSCCIFSLFGSLRFLFPGKIKRWYHSVLFHAPFFKCAEHTQYSHFWIWTKCCHWYKETLNLKGIKSIIEMTVSYKLLIRGCNLSCQLRALNEATRKSFLLLSDIQYLKLFLWNPKFSIYYWGYHFKQNEEILHVIYPPRTWRSEYFSLREFFKPVTLSLKLKPIFK